jgi:predicted permease
MSALAAELAATHEYDRGWGVNIVPLDEQIVGDVRTALLVVFAAVGLVLLLVCVNVANLLVVHLSSRRRELAVRTAMGAHPSRLVRQLVTESFVLAALGCLAGVLVAVQTVDALVALAPADLPGLDRVGIDATALAYAAALAVVTATAVSLMPALGLLGRRTAQDLRDGGTRTTDRGQRVRNVLVTAQVALALVLAVSAGLLAKSFSRLRGVEPGFDASGVLAARVNPPRDAYPDDQSRARFYDEVVGRLATVPGIRAAGATVRLPLDGLWIGTSFRLFDRPEPTPEDRPVADIRSVTPGYFRTMDIPLLDGRDFVAGDRAEAPNALVINETMARTFWPDGSPIGQEVSINLGDPRYVGRVVGVVGDVKHQGLDYVPRSMIYLAHSQFTPGSMHFVVRTDGDPTQLAGAVRRVVRDVDPALPVYGITTVGALVDRALAADRFSTTLLGAFALLALTLAAVGIYGVIAYSVARRTAELGIRIALGAARQRILRLVLRQGVLLVAWGTGLGLLGAALVTQPLSGLLFEVSPRDVGVFALTAALLITVAIAACLLPAHRAAAIDPIQALRQE